MGTAPLALGGLLHIGVQADHVICTGARVAQDDFTPLLADLTVVLVVRLIAITILLCQERTGIKEGSPHDLEVFQ